MTKRVFGLPTLTQNPHIAKNCGERSKNPKEFLVPSSLSGRTLDVALFLVKNIPLANSWPELFTGLPLYTQKLPINCLLVASMIKRVGS